MSADAAFDTAALTGESMPRTISEGGEVLAGMVATDSVSRIRVSRPAGQSAVARILSMVEEASGRKAPAEPVHPQVRADIHPRGHLPCRAHGACALRMVAR